MTLIDLGDPRVLKDPLVLQVRKALVLGMKETIDKWPGLRFGKEAGGVQSGHLTLMYELSGSTPEGSRAWESLESDLQTLVDRVAESHGLVRRAGPVLNRYGFVVSLSGTSVPRFEEVPAADAPTTATTHRRPWWKFWRKIVLPQWLRGSEGKESDSQELAQKPAKQLDSSPSRISTTSQKASPSSAPPEPEPSAYSAPTGTREVAGTLVFEITRAADRLAAGTGAPDVGRDRTLMMNHILALVGAACADEFSGGAHFDHAWLDRHVSDLLGKSPTALGAAELDSLLHTYREMARRGDREGLSKGIEGLLGRRINRSQVDLLLLFNAKTAILESIDRAAKELRSLS